MIKPRLVWRVTDNWSVRMIGPMPTYWVEEMQVEADRFVGVRARGYPRRWRRTNRWEIEARFGNTIGKTQ